MASACKLRWHYHSFRTAHVVSVVHGFTAARSLGGSLINNRRFNLRFRVFVKILTFMVTSQKMVNLGKEMAWAASVPQYLLVLDSFGPSPTSLPRGDAALLFFLPARIKFTRRPCYSKLKSGLKKIVTQAEPITRLKKRTVAWKHYRYKQLRACLLEWPVGGEREEACASFVLWKTRICLPTFRRPGKP